MGRLCINVCYDDLISGVGSRPRGLGGIRQLGGNIGFSIGVANIDIVRPMYG